MELKFSFRKSTPFKSTTSHKHKLIRYTFRNSKFVREIFKDLNFRIFGTVLSYVIKSVENVSELINILFRFILLFLLCSLEILNSFQCE